MEFGKWTIKDNDDENVDASELASTITVSTDDFAQYHWRKFESVIKDVLSTFISHLPSITISVNQDFFRGRKWEEGRTFKNVREIKAPPAYLAGAGRINPVGLPFLYVADSIGTALREVHQKAGTPTTIAKCSPNRELRIIDLTHGIEEEDKVHSFRRIINNNFSKPVELNKTIVEYLPTQVIALYIKDQLKLDGVKYKSSVNAGGYNIVLFDESNMNFWQKILFMNKYEPYKSLFTRSFSDDKILSNGSTAPCLHWRGISLRSGKHPYPFTNDTEFISLNKNHIIPQQPLSVL
ncbi:RES family NAD+ phosphorylase [Paenibacillus sp. FSL L8-0463]|uniref:RES family NAD+ phosphorylase n=1 Tax=Paenibacillus sp. FSL L8-0463 TaxID=2954687 RepID=UPI003119A814